VSLPLFETFLEEYRERVYRFLIATVGPQEADDCFQETFLSALRAYPRLRAGSNLQAWVMTIAQRKALDHHRRGGRELAVGEVPERPAPERDGHDPALWAAVRRLPPKQRAAVAHRFAGDLPYGDLAALLGCSEEAARRSVHEGLKKLRKELIHG
jgi:RNA polymerase sigma factor (sigma-70 family)